MSKQQERTVQGAEASLKAAEARLQHLREVERERRKPRSIHPDDTGQDFEKMMQDCKMDIDQARAFLERARNPSKPIDPIAKVKKTLRDLDEYERTGEPNPRTRESLERRLAGLEGRPLPPKTRGKPLFAGGGQGERIAELEARLNALELEG